MSLAGVITVVGVLVALGGAPARAADDPPRPPSLKTVAVPEPAGLEEYVRDRRMAIALGKALFWDMQVGSDGVQACATCHFQAGADGRLRHQLNPGRHRVLADGTADPDDGWSAPHGLNALLHASDFPLSPASNDVVGSQGIALFAFAGLAGGPGERLVPVPDPDGFRLQDLNLRRTTPRHAPTVVNAVFNDRQFWDGRAPRVFNGVNVLGADDPDARVVRADDPDAPELVAVRIAPASLASQALGPIVNDVEMAAAGRKVHDLARKLLGGHDETGRRLRRLRPLAGQRVHPDDSVLGPFSRWPAPGLRVSRYDRLIAKAFQPRWWASRRLVRTAPEGTVDFPRTRDADPATIERTQLEQNFALFFGLAIQLYESTLVADDTPWDRFMAGDTTAVSAQAVAGADVFRSQTRGRCINCHEGAELTGASVRRVGESPTRIREGQALDRGFNNIGILPTTEDPGVGGRGATGKWLSTVRRLATPPAEPIAIDGAMKVPGLRNVALTAPYFHTGGFLTLRQVLEFYSRGGDVRPQHTLDGTVEIAPLNVLGNTPGELDVLEAWLLSLTDARVRDRRAPFDHPQLFVPDGHVLADDGTGTARDDLIEIPAVGRDGGVPVAELIAAHEAALEAP